MECDTVAEEEDDLGNVDDEIRTLYDEMMEVNFKIIKRSRRQAQRLEDILDLYAEQIQRVSDLKRLHIEAARSLSDTVGDILTAEWDIEDADNDDEEDDDDE